MITTRQLARLVVAGALAATLAGCTGSEEPPDDPAAPTTSSTGSASPAEEPVLAGELTRAFAVPMPAYKDPAQVIDVLGPVFTEDLVLFTDEHDFLHAIDRSTGRERWRVKRRSTSKGGDTPCALTLPTPDAEVVVMNHGLGQWCGYFTVYSLADGSITEEYDSVPREGRRINFNLAINSDLVLVEGRTYFLDADDNLLRLEADGTTSSVGSPAVLVDADEEWTTNSLVALPGSDVMMARLQTTDGDVELDEDEDGKLIGFRINDSDLPELVWQQDIRTLMSKKSSPGHVRGRFAISPDVPGAIGDGFRAGAGLSTRYRVIDPETGELSSPGFTFGSNPDDLPAFVLPQVIDQSLRAADSSVFTPITPRGQVSPIAVRRLDLASGEAMWSWSIPGTGKGAISAAADVISTSSDGSLVYVRTAVDFDGRLWELDAATGELVRSWQFSDRPPEVYDLDSSRLSIDDGDVFRLNTSTDGEKLLAALYR